MPLDQALDERARSAADAAADLIQSLKDGNAIRTSEQRTSTIASLIDQQGALAFAVLAEDQTRVLSAIEEIYWTGEIVQDLQELALIEWQAQYALFLQGFPLEQRDHFWPLAHTWTRVPARYKRGSSTVPGVVRDTYVMDLVQRFEAILAYEARQIGRLKDVGCLHIDDFRPLALRLRMLATAARSAERAVDEHVRSEQARATIRRQRQALVAQQPGVARGIWSVVGWDSGADFLTDVVLIGTTGGVGVAFRWAKRANKARRTLRNSRRATRTLRGKIDDLEEQLRRLEQNEAAIRNNAARIQRSGQKAGKLMRRIGELRTKLRRKDAITAYTKQMMDELAANPKKLVRGIAQNVIADGLLGVSGTGGVVAQEVVRTAIRRRLDVLHPFSQIDDFKTHVVREALLDVAHPGYDAMSEYFKLLLGREILTRLIFEVARKRAITPEIAANVIISSFGAVGQELFVSFGLPKALGESFAADVVAVIRKYAADLLQGLAKRLADAV